MTGTGDRDGSRDGDRDEGATLVTGAVVVHLALTLPHGIVHGVIPVYIADWQGAYAAVVLFGLPLGGLWAVRRGRVRRGAWLALVGGLGGFAFETLAHFVVPNPDHVATVETGRALFAGTAGLSVLGDAALAVAAAYALWSQAQGSSATSPSDSTT
ncbi:MAG: hypothetical protein ABEJ26_02720 [Halosimplex sp.]